MIEITSQENYQVQVVAACVCFMYVWHHVILYCLQMNRVVGTEGSLDDAGLLAALRGLVFGDFMVPGADPKIYTEIKDQTAMTRVVQEYLSDFNATSKKPMNLVIFQVR